MKNKLSKDNIRNLQVLIFSVILNFSFAIEKLCNITWNQQSDFVWFIVYGWLWLVVAGFAVYDYIQDIKEENKNSNYIML